MGRKIKDYAVGADGKLVDGTYADRKTVAPSALEGGAGQI